MLSALPDAHGLTALILTVVALVLFTRDQIPLETSCLIVLILLVVVFEFFPFEQGGISIQPTEFFSGFGHEALITISALMILGKGIETTGALKPLALMLAQGWQARPAVAMLLTLVLAAVLSAFVNNTPIVVMMLPLLVGVSIRARRPTSGILMPMGLATLLGGMSTTIGTSTNLLVVAIAADLGLRRMNMFDFTMPVLIAGSIGILYLWLIAPRLLPHRQALLSDTSPRVFSAMLYVQDESFANGRTLSEVLAKTENRMRVDRIQRGESLYLAKLPSVRLQSGDRLIVNDTPDNLKEFESLLGITLHNAADAHPVTAEHPLTAGGQQLAEVVVTRGSLLHHRTLKRTRFSTRYRLLPLAIHRAKTHTVDSGADIADIRLRAGDVLLVQGTPKSIEELKSTGDMLVLDGTTDLPHTHRAKRALTIILAVIVPAALDLVPISVSALTGVGLMILTRCITWRDVGSALSAPVIMVIVVSLALGTALLKTGAAAYLAHLFTSATADLPVPMVMSGLMLMMSIITNVVSNNAAAVIGTPIAINIASDVGAPPEAFVLAVLFGANMSYATPIGYQTNLLIFSAGGYKFTDFLRAGIPLTIIMWLSLTILLTMRYDL